MDRVIIRISCAAYIVAMSLAIWFVYNPPGELSVEFQTYMEWWYSVPMTEVEAIITNICIAAFALTLVGVISLFFLKRWGGYLFLASVIPIFVLEPFMTDFTPRTSIETTLDSVASVSIGCILVIMLLSGKLETFEHKNV